jgi:hypothetical protein
MAPPHIAAAGGGTDAAAAGWGWVDYWWDGRAREHSDKAGGGKEGEEIFAACFALLAE